MTPRRLTIAFLLLLLALTVSGCNATSGTATQRWAVARESLTRSQNVVLAAHKAGHVSDAQLVDADRLVQAARRALARAEAELPEGDGEFSNLIELVADVAQALLAADAAQTRKAIEAYKATPPTAAPEPQPQPEPEGGAP